MTDAPNYIERSECYARLSGRIWEKSNIYPVSAQPEYLNAPECIINKAPSAALFDGQTDETEMGVSYAALDAFLSGEAIDEETRQIIDRMHTVSEHKRAEIVRYSDNTIQ